MRIHDVIDAWRSALARARPFVAFHLGSDVPDTIGDLPEDAIAALDGLPDAKAFQAAFDELAGQMMTGLSASIDDWRRRERELLEANNRYLERARAAEAALAALKASARAVSLPVVDVTFGGKVAAVIVAVDDHGGCELWLERMADAEGLRAHDRITILLPGEASDG